MRSTLHLKFLLVYITYGFLILFSVSAIVPQILLERMEMTTADNLYKDASVLSTEYLPEYFLDDISVVEVHTQIIGMQHYTNANLWFVTPKGELITSATLPGYPIAPKQIATFDPAEHGNKLYQVGTYHNFFSEDMITVIAPVTTDYEIRGYLLAHKPVSHLLSARDYFLVPIYFTAFIIYLLSVIIIAAFHFFVYRPLRQITEAAKQYALGNLDYEIPVTTQDEIGYLSASLNYMSSQLKDMEDYQKKFIGNVSHDFRSPLTSIKGYLQAMADGTIPVELQDKYFKIILFETDRLTALTEDLLTLNQFDTKDLLLDKTFFNLHEMIKMTAATFEGSCTTKRISIELRFATKVLNVLADKSKIQRVFYNLIDNAIKFSPNDSKIIIETTERNEKVLISIKDFGMGIPKKSLSKIWDRFYKSDLSRGKDKKGTGLGLAIVKEIIQAHNENINVVSTEGVGTEFTFTLKKG